MPTTTSNLSTLLGAEPTQNLAGGISEGVKTGIQLATAADQVEASKIKVQEQKMDVESKIGQAFSNRMKAYLYAPNNAAADSILKNFESYGNAIGRPVNAEGLKS